MDGSEMRPRALVHVQDLSVHFEIGGRSLTTGEKPKLRAVDGVTLEVFAGETLGLVGESGCGKSTAGRAILNLQRPTSGRVVFDGQPLEGLGKRRMRDMRRRMQMVFQDPYASLNPRMKVRDILAEPLQVHGLAGGAARQARILELLSLVGLEDSALDRYPHEFSGGQRQRIGIARALAVEPEFLVLDESIAALDVSIQAQVINLLKRLQRDRGMAYLFISHDMAVVRHMSDRVAVMYLGQVVEQGTSAQIYGAPCHPYTRALLKAVPVPHVPEDGTKPVLEGIRGELARPTQDMPGCRFCNRCPQVQDRCRREAPLLEVKAGGQLAACHFA